jgi:DNA-binding transcriptional ArsR family regulator
MADSRQCCSELYRWLSPRFFKALSDPNRVAILVRLAECCGEISVSQIAECCPVDVSVVSRHLATLREAGIARSVKRGKEVFYSIDAGALVRTLRKLADAIERCCPPKEEKR